MQSAQAQAVFNQQMMHTQPPPTRPPPNIPPYMSPRMPPTSNNQMSMKHQMYMNNNQMPPSHVFSKVGKLKHYFP